MLSGNCNTDKTTDNKVKAEDDALRNNDYVKCSRTNLEGQEDAAFLFDEARGQDGTKPSQGPISAMLRVPTKTQDGGQVSSTQDAFMLHSDDNMKMMTILGLHDGEDGQLDDNDMIEEFNQWCQGGRARRRRRDGDDESDGQDNANDNGKEPSLPERKTRISFEVHDSVFMFMFFNR